MHTLATLFALRQSLGISATDISEDARLILALQTATQQIQRETRRHFSPYYATHHHSLNLCDVREIVLEDDLLELISVTNGDQTPINVSDTVVLYNAILHLINNQAFVYDETPLQAIAVTGIWGWHDNWHNAWRNTSDSVQNVTFSDSDTVLNVTDADGADSTLQIPRFAVGQLLRCESEYLIVTSVNTATNQIGVLRGANGSIASVHAQNTPIYSYQPPSDVVNACLQLATAHYQAPDQKSPSLLTNSPRDIWTRLQI